MTRAVALQRALLVAVIVALGLAAALAVVLARGVVPGPADVAELVATGAGIFDSHPDPQVGRVLQPGLSGRVYEDHPVDSNSFGMREREYALPKPAGTVRIVLLGDSYVFGWRVEVPERVGDVLEQLLVEHQHSDGPISVPVEVLSLGIPTWNLTSSAQWLRRQLDLIDPDVVIHVTVPNDVNDSSDVRGFGANARSSSQAPERVDGLLYEDHPVVAFGSGRPNLLGWGLDWESQRCYARMLDAAQALSAAVSDRGGHYRLLLDFGLRTPVAWRLLVSRLPPGLAVWIPAEFGATPEHNVRLGDPHWSPLAQRRVAHLLYAVLVEQQLVPSLQLPILPAADAELTALHAAGQAQALLDIPTEDLMGGFVVASAIDVEALDEATMTLVHGGLDSQGRTSPYASFVLRNAGATRLELTGRGLDREGLDGARLTILADEFPLHELVLARDVPVELSLPLPAALAERPYLSIRLVSSDFVDAADDIRHAVTFRLRSLALLP